MLFRRDIDPYCVYCAHGNKLNDREVMCIKQGVVTPDYSCRKFQYDPLKRTPPKPARLDLTNISDDDFKL